MADVAGKTPVPGDTNNQDTNTQNSTNNQNNNSDNNDADALLNPWDNSANNSDQQQQQQQQQQQTQQVDRTALDQHLKRYNLVTFDPQTGEEFMTHVRDGNVTGIQDVLNEGIRGVAEQLLMDVDALIKNNNRTQDARMQQIASGYDTANSMLSRLEQEIPLAQEPMFKPTVQGIFNKYLKSLGGDQNKALAETKKYFEKMTGQKINSDPKPKNQRNSFNSPLDDDEGDDETGLNFDDIFGEKG